jgi:glycosyltransferase involved in cell wall biosynthesis
MPDASAKPQPRVIVLGVFPPPVTGMSVCTERIAKHLAERFDVVRANLSDGSPRITWAFRFKKLLRLIGALVRLAFKPGLRGAVLYMPLNATAAMWYNLCAAAIARVRGWRTIVHHHVYLYLNNRDWRVKLLDRLMGRRGLHLPLCADMRRRLIEQYDIQAPCAFVPSTIMLAGEEAAPLVIPAPDDARPVRRLGHISNLTQAKGALIAIRTFEKLHEEGADVELVLAGPMTEPVVEQEIAAAKAKFGDRFDYRGPVYGAAKTAFFEDIDILLFPSTFRFEAQPIVLSEAFAFGKPALAFGISCIPTLVDAPQWHVCPQGDFVTFAGHLFKQWQKSPDDYAAARRFAVERAESLKREAAAALDNLSAWVAGQPTDGFVLDASAPRVAPVVSNRAVAAEAPLSRAAD